MIPERSSKLLCAWSMMMLLIASLCACERNSDTESFESTNQASIEFRLKRLEDKESIRHLLIDYGTFLDRRDFASFSRLFSEQNGEWIGGMGRAKGRRAIQNLMEEKIGSNPTGPNLSSHHLFQNEHIDIDGNRAVAETKWVFVIQNRDEQPELMYLGHYEDQLIRDVDGWKFLKRVVFTDIPKDNPER